MNKSFILGVPVCSNFGYLFIWYQSTNIARLDRRNRARLTQVPLTLLIFGREDMALEAFVAFDLTGSRNAKSFRCCPVGFDFWHVLLLEF
jgi:hypothetical protein